MEQPKRKHRATGNKPPGGARPGAGRKPGSDNVLPLGAIQAIKALKHRVPQGASAGEVELASRALQRVVDVLEERVSHFAMGHVLKAATILREEVCGPLAQKHEHSGPEGGALVIEVHKYTEETP